VLAFALCAPIFGASSGLPLKPRRSPANTWPELPAIPSLELPRPAPQQIWKSSTRGSASCARATKPSAKAARREALEIDAKFVPAIRFRLGSIAESSKHDELKQLLLKNPPERAEDDRTRRAARRRQAQQGSKLRDYLQMARASTPEAALEKPGAGLVSVLAESRMLAPDRHGGGPYAD